MKTIFSPRSYTFGADCALLLLRLVCGYAFMRHGSSKIQDPFHWMHDTTIPPVFLALAALSEFGGGLAWILGLLTRLASFGIFCTMAVAASMHRLVWGQPFIASGGGPAYELAAVYLCIALLLMMMGPGRFSLDRICFGRARR